MPRSQRIAHVAVVRFSLRLSESWSARAYGEESNRAIWLHYRKRLLDATLTESLLRQSRRPDMVFILLDVDDKAVIPHETFDSLYTPLYVQKGRYMGEMQQRLEKNGLSDHLAISRIDSDDVLSRHYFREVNRAALKANEDRVWIVAPEGFRSDLSSIQRFHYRSAPFQTLYSRAFERQNVYAMNHEWVNRENHVFVDSSEGLWMQMLHGGNLANQFRSDPVSPNRFEKRNLGGRKLITLEPRAFDADWFLAWSGFESLDRLRDLMAVALPTRQNEA